MFVLQVWWSRCHQTLEGVIKKCVERQEDWAIMIDSVLLGMRSQTHSSNGYSPMRMLDNKDPVLPFEIADKVNHTIDDDSQGDWVKTGLNSDSAANNLINTVEKIEEKCDAIFKSAHKI